MNILTVLYYSGYFIALGIAFLWWHKRSKSKSGEKINE